MNTQFDKNMETFFNARKHKDKILIREDWLVFDSPPEEARDKCEELVRKQYNWIIENKWPDATIEYSGGDLEDRVCGNGSVILQGGCVIATLYNKQDQAEKRTL